MLWNLVTSPFGGTVYPVNPKRPSVLGVKAYASVSDIPEDGGSGGDRDAAAVDSRTDPGVRRERRAGRDRHLGRLQGDRTGRRGAGAATAGGGAEGQHPDHRAELPGRDEPAFGLERHVRHHGGAAGHGGFHQPERRAVHGGAGLEPEGDGRLQRVRLRRLDGGRRLGRPDLLPGQRSEDASHRDLHGDRSAMRARSCRRRAKWR